MCVLLVWLSSYHTCPIFGEHLLSPYMIITLYDEDVYEMTTRGIIISDRNHVDILNRFQVANAESNVYYKTRHMEKWITKYKIQISR